jgi:Flp pilus assembly protein TadB
MIFVVWVIRLYNENWYYNGCKFTARNFSWLVKDIDTFRQKADNAISESYRDAMIYTGLGLDPHETVLFAYVSAAFTLIGIIIFDFFLLRMINLEHTALYALIILSLLFPLCVLIYMSEYIKIHAKWMKVSSLGDMPEIISYIVMSMKLVPNMEVAIRFAAGNSGRPLSKDLKKMMWNLHVREYRGIDEAIIEFSNLWGKNSEYFKRALHLIKSSTSEPDEAQRVITLNRSLDLVLESTRDLMDSFAAKLKTPTYVLYSIFILIPLSLVALMPAITVVGIRFGTGTLVILYNIVLPLLTFIYAEYILMQRPAAFVPQEIPENHPHLAGIKEKKLHALIFASAIGLLISSLGYILVYRGNPWNIVSTSTLDGIIPPTLFIIWGIVFAVSVYLNISYAPYKKIRDEIRKMENEFSDALFVLGRRVSEGRSAEEAFSHTARTMQGSDISLAFERISLNLMNMRTDIHSAIFDRDFGAFRDIYSERIRTTMLLMVESVQKSHEVAGVAIVKLADHLKELQDVEIKIRQSLYDMTSTMRSTAAVFAPLIAGVTIALSEVITKILQNISDSIKRLPENAFPGPAQISADNLNQSIPSDIFMFAIGIYIIMITVILVRFSGTIEYGGDRTQLLYEIGQILPVTIIIFTVSTVFSRILFRGMI